MGLGGRKEGRQEGRKEGWKDGVEGCGLIASPEYKLVCCCLEILDG